VAGCSAIKPNGERCRGIAATDSDYCPAHDPSRAEARKRNARKAARSRGSARGSGSELKQVKQGVRTVIAAVVRGRLDKGRGAVALQGYNTLLRAVEIGQRDELEDLAREVEDLKRGYSGAA
jgi:hypothetical protein